MIRYEVLYPREFRIKEHKGMFYAEERVRVIEITSNYLFWKKEKRSLEWAACVWNMDTDYNISFLSPFPGFESKKELKEEIKKRLKEPVYHYDVLNDDINIRLKLDSMDYEQSLNELKSKIGDLHKQYIGKKEERAKSNNHDVTTWTHNNEDESKGSSKGTFISDTAVTIKDIELKNVKAAVLELYESGKWNVSIDCDSSQDVYDMLGTVCGFKAIRHDKEWHGLVSVIGTTSVDGVMRLELRGIGKLRVIPEV